MINPNARIVRIIREHIQHYDEKKIGQEGKK